MPNVSHVAHHYLAAVLSLISFSFQTHFSDMTRKSKKWSEVVLRQAIGEAILSRHLQNKPIDREAIEARYLGRCPRHSEFIKGFVVR